MNHIEPSQLIAFEKRIADLFNAGELPYLIHLSGGNEEVLCNLFEQIKDGDWILSTHRNHYHYLLAGGSPAELEQLIRDGKSMFVFNRKLNFLTSSIVGGMCSIAAGIAWSIKRNQSQNYVWCFVGDAVADGGHFWEAVHWVEANNLPCFFVLEDNDRSCESTKVQRRGSCESHHYPPCVRWYNYTASYPHAGSGTKQRIVFKCIQQSI